jgi:glycosyltransferase involved in cell wall biosynthesis
MHKLIAINGESWCRKMTGVERLAVEVTGYLDSMAQPGEIELVVPSNAENVPALHNIRVVRLHTPATFFPKWTQGAFQRYVITHHALSLDFSNTCPFFCPGIEFIHDIYSRLYPQDFVSKRDRLICLYADIMYRTIAKRAKHIVTVSEFTKKTIVDTYHTDPGRISVVYSGIGNYRTIVPDESVFDRLPGLNGKAYYFTLGSLSTRKNLAWIAVHAEKHPDEFFVVSGKPISGVVTPGLEKMKTLKNVLFTGYLSDAEVKAVLGKCRAFIFPSYFEGYGLPPLEALSCGAPVIISDRTSLPEIYGSCAHYIDPDNPDVNLDELLSEHVDAPDALLEKFTLLHTAERLYEIIRQAEDGK